MKKILCIAAAAIAASAPAIAQPDPELAPISGQIALSSGFTPDPRVIPVSAGGSNPAANISASCRGFISNAPDVRLVYSAGNLPLIISVASRADTTLVVNGPDGSWYCDDDSGSGNNPRVRLNNPGSGRYEIWVGTYRSGSTQSSRLHISELTSQ
jgi:hypothetical protein